jgi:hypothetical protein
MLTSAMGYLSGTDATAMAAETQARCLQELERVTADGHGRPGVDPGRVHLRAGLQRGRGLQPPRVDRARTGPWCLQSPYLFSGSGVYVREMS